MGKGFDMEVELGVKDERMPFHYVYITKHELVSVSVRFLFGLFNSSCCSYRVRIILH